MKKQITAEMKDLLLRPDDLLENMKKIKENKTPGIDKIHLKVLIGCCYTLSLILCLELLLICEYRIESISMKKYTEVVIW